MTEPSLVWITDFILTLECFAIAIVLRKKEPAAIGFFISVAIAAFLGALVHGPFMVTTGVLSALAWKATLLSIGCAGISLYKVGSRWLPLHARAHQLVLGLYVSYVITVLFFIQAFWVAILGYLPALLYFAGAQIKRRHSQLAGARWGFLAVILVLIGSVQQQMQIVLGPIDHNSLYHFIEMFAMLAFGRSVAF